MTAVLAELMRQAEEDGATLPTLRAIAEEAGELSSRRTLERLGLSDPGAAKDMAELRERLAAWRDAKRSALNAIVAWIARMSLAVVLVSLAMKLGFSGWVR